MFTMVGVEKNTGREPPVRGGDRVAQGFVGADVQQLKDLAAQLKTAGAGFGTIEGRLSALVSGAAWRGPDAGRFSSDWHSIHRPSLRTASELLRSRALDLAKQASEQEAASAASGAGIPRASDATASPSLESEFTQFSSGKKTPYEVAGWWSKLSVAEQQKLIAEHPEIVGNLDGVNFTDRDTANRLVLDQQIAVARSSGDTKLAEYLGNVKKSLPDGSSPKYQLISLHTDDPPRAAIAVGNLDKADYASYLVPGMGSNSAGTVSDLTNTARDIYDEEHRLALANGASTNISVVAWMNYDSPENEFLNSDVLHGDLARQGGAELQQAILGYDAVLGSQPGRSSSSSYLTIDAHSYGSTTTANALDGMPKGVVDSVVSVGSAGIEGSLKDTYGSNVPDGQVYAIQAKESGDVAWWGRVGSGRTDPRPLSQVSDLSSDASVMDGQSYSATNVHDLNNGKAEDFGYLESGSTSLHNVAYVNLGMGDRAAR